MPWAPKQYCREQGCGELCSARERYCEAHRKARQRADDTKKERVRFYDSPEWKEFKVAFLKANRWCVECMKVGVNTRSHTVDHVVPIKQGGARLDHRNAQALCFSCHQRKRGKERHGLKL